MKGAGIRRFERRHLTWQAAARGQAVVVPTTSPQVNCSRHAQGRPFLRVTVLNSASTPRNVETSGRGGVHCRRRRGSSCHGRGIPGRTGTPHAAGEADDAEAVQGPGAP